MSATIEAEIKRLQELRQQRKALVQKQQETHKRIKWEAELAKSHKTASSTDNTQQPENLDHLDLDPRQQRKALVQIKQQEAEHNLNLAELTVRQQTSSTDNTQK